MSREAFDMTEPKKKLRTLGAYLSGIDSYTIMYAQYLADRLNPELVPMGFILGCELTIHDIQNGVDGCTQEPIPAPFGKLVGMPDIFYRLLRMNTPLIAKAVLEPADAAAVETEYKAMMAHVTKT